VRVRESSGDPAATARATDDPFVDRTRPLATLRQAWERAREGHGGVVLVSGAVGAGRARLAEELGHLARRDGAHVIYGAVAADLPLSTLPILAVVDDLENVVVAPLPMLRKLVVDAQQSRLLVVGRVEERSRRTRELEAAGALLVRLEAFDAHAVATFSERLLGRPLPARVLDEVLARTRGNALFLRELLRLLEGEGWLGDEVQAVAALRSWRRVRDVVARRLLRLSGPCRRLLELAAVQGTHFHVGVLRAAAGDETEGLLDRLDEAERAAVVGPSPWRPGQYRFAHPVLATVAREFRGT
jgi:predicted ATPase